MNMDIFFYNFNSIKEYLDTIISGTIHWCLSYLNEIYWQIVISFISYLFLCIFLYIIIKKVDNKAWQLPGPPSRLLIVTAHPDDEIMFFGPLIYWTVRLKTTKIYLLCMTMGGNKKRKEELWSCARKLGIPEANITIVMSTELPDNASVLWSESLVADYILQHIESYKINALVTFDKYGISKHKNHISLYYAVASLCLGKKVPPYCKLYALETVNILRKYTQLLDLPISLLSSSYWYLITYRQRKYIHDGMKVHESQYVWFRKLYMIFSRYTLINTFQEINLLDLELNLQLDYEAD